MSNILIIKHGSLGDLIQANGAIKDIKESFKDSKIFLLTATSYKLLMSDCPYVDEVLIDERLPRWNLFFLYKLKNLLLKYNFIKVFDLQNSSRTRFYRKFLLKKPEWSSTETTLEPGQKKSDFDQAPVLDRMEVQLKKSNINTHFIKNIDLQWAKVDISHLIKLYAETEYILLFPFCSEKHPDKKWPYFKDLILKLKEDYGNKYSILLAPGPNEINEANELSGTVVLEEKKSINIRTLISLISQAKFIVANDTGPAHIASHLGKKGIVLFGGHTTPKKVSIENNNFQSIIVKNLKNLNVNEVLDKIKTKLN